jgi:hypothetical protein|tara:strand:- start:3173 stop:4156 length:984 start_codon:yes stop_codon:yes gene_type:complete
MSIVLDANYSSRQIYLTSADANIKVGGRTSDVTFYFDDIIQVPNGVNIHLSVVNSQIPVAFYAVDTGRNTLDFTKTIGGVSTDATITITTGNYNINEFLAFLNAQTFFSDDSTVATYNNETNTVTFTLASSSNTLVLKSTSTALQFVGFTVKDHTSSSGVLTGDRMVNVGGVNAINIASNFSTRNLDSRHSGFSNIIARVPVDRNFNNIIFYEPNTKFSSQIIEKEINYIRLTLEDDVALNPINLHGVDWSITLQVDFSLDKPLQQQQLNLYNKKGFVPQIAKYSKETQERLRKLRQDNTTLRKRIERQKLEDERLKGYSERLKERL